MVTLLVWPERGDVCSWSYPLVHYDGAPRRRDRYHDIGAAHDVGEVRRHAQVELRVFRLLCSDEVIKRCLRPAPDPHLLPRENVNAGGKRAFGHVTGADDRKPLGIPTGHPFGRDRCGCTGTHHRVIAAIANCQREASLWMGVDEDREHRWQVIFYAVAFADRNPF